MTVNYDIWGAPETWVDGSTAEQKANIKFAESSHDTYRENYDNGNIELNSIDLPCYWGIGKGSIFRQPHYLSPYQSDGETVVAVDDVIDESQTTFPMMFFTATTVSQQNTRFDYRYSPRRTTSPPQAMPYNAKIVMNFSYKDIILEPIVLYKDSAFSSSNRATTLYNYIENAIYETYPQITGIGYTSYAGDGTTNRSKIYFYPLTTFTIKEYDLYYGSNYFWCQYLSKFLINGVEIGTAQTPTIGATHTLTTTDILNTVGDSVTALAYKYSVSESTRVYLYYFDANNDLWQINKTVVRSGDTKWYTYPYIETTAANAETVRDYVLSQIAFLGLPFVYDPSKSARGQIGETGVYLPKFDNKGVTTGEYAEGADALTLPNSQWTDGRESGYDPDAGEDDDGDTGNINNTSNPSNRFGARGLKIWALYQQNVDEILQHVNELYLDSQTPVESWQTDFKGVNPSDYIVGLYAMLLNPDKSANTETFQLGVVDFDGELNYYRYNDANYFSCGRITVPAKNNFLDYEPYTTAELYLPLCGTVDIDMKFFAGHEMEVIYYYDPLTMSCTAAIYRISSSGTTLYKTANGTIGASIPVTSMQMGTYQNKIHALEAAQKQNEMRLATSALAIGIGGAAAVATGGASLIAAGGIIGGAATLASGIEQGKNIEYEIEHTPPAISQTGTAEPQNGFCVGDLIPKLFIKRAKMLTSYDAETYGKTVGFACCINSTVGAFSGYTVYSNVDLSGIPATKTEIDMIRAKLNSGIYI